MLLILVAAGCVSGGKIRADSEVIRTEIAQARRAGAMQCAPEELATAEAHLDFARAELSNGAGYRAEQHVRTADAAIKKALDLLQDCLPKPPVVVKVAEADRDGDGIPDSVDRCPDEPEDFDGFQDEDGCPDPDNDGDGVLDVVDRCPNTPGPASNFGCPIQDADGDGVADEVDRCPNTPGPASNFGCPEPEKIYKRLVVKEDRIEIKQQIKFKSGSAKIVGKDSFAILREVAQALNDHPQIKKIRIEGHTDSVGGDAQNLKLSQNRASAVMSELIKDSVDPARMEAWGYGKMRPIASNSTASGRTQNRRTEFNIVEQ